MFAALQMYDWPEVRAETDAFWRAVREALTAHDLPGEENLHRGEDLAAAWRDPGLLLGQTCGLPLTLGLAAPAQPFARPSYGVEGCGSGTYCSVLLAREAGTLGDFKGARAAINGWDSQSGCNALKDAVAGYPAPFFAEVRVTGAHRASADALWAGEADLCALDAVAWALYQMAEPARAAALHPVCWSAVTPSLPYVTSPAFAAHAPALVAALEAAIQALPPSPALPVAVMPASLADYAPIAEMNARVAGLPLGPGDG